MYIVLEHMPYEVWYEIINSIDDLKEEIEYCKKNGISYKIYEIKKEIKNV